MNGNDIAKINLLKSRADSLNLIIETENETIKLIKISNSTGLPVILKTFTSVWGLELFICGYENAKSNI